MTSWINETYNGNFRIALRSQRTLFREESDYQSVTIVDTDALGRALLLDDVWMTSEKGERFYHEYIVHPAMNVAPHIKRVLVIGGGDGGTVREILRYNEVEHVDMIEIDGMVIDACKEFLPSIGTAWDDPRLTVTVGDGIDYVKNATVEPYDVILVDGADPVGPAEGLFNKSFFEGCARLMTEKGVFATQAESPDHMEKVHVEMLNVLDEVFAQVAPYYGGVNIYPGAWWGWIMATKGVAIDSVVEERVARISEVTDIYNLDIHRGAFAVPNFIRRQWKR